MSDYRNLINIKSSKKNIQTFCKSVFNIDDVDEFNNSFNDIHELDLRKCLLNVKVNLTDKSSQKANIAFCGLEYPVVGIEDLSFQKKNNLFNLSFIYQTSNNILSNEFLKQLYQTNDFNQIEIIFYNLDEERAGKMIVSNQGITSEEFHLTKKTVINKVMENPDYEDKGIDWNKTEIENHPLFIPTILNIIDTEIPNLKKKTKTKSF